MSEEKIVPLNRVIPCHDIAASARRFADDVEAGKFGTALNVMLVLERKQPGELSDLEVFGWGPDAVRFHATGMLRAAEHCIMRRRPDEQ